MDNFLPFHLKNGQWYAENVALEAIAKAHGTPCYVYSRKAIENHWLAFQKAFQAFDNLSFQINYAVKANSNLAILHILNNLGSGFDIVSGGELARVLKAGGKPHKILFSGVGKSATEISTALKAGVGCINVESESELLRINEIAGTLGIKAPIAIRVNPDVDPESHRYISTGLHSNKFGIPLKEAFQCFLTAATLPNLQIQGIGFHIGSQIMKLEPILQAFDKILVLILKLKEHNIFVSHLNVGGGLGVCYRDEKPPQIQEYVNAIVNKLQTHKLEGVTLHIEPGRAIAANAGVLLTRVEYIKPQNEANKYFAIVDAAMNDLLRPALYEAWQEIVAVQEHESLQISEKKYDIVGPVCESADFLGIDRLLNLDVGSLLAIRSAGAYGFSMSSNYNSRPRAAEILVEDDSFRIVRPRESIEELFHAEKL